MSKILDLKNVSITYKTNKREVLAADDITFSIDQGQSVGIVGESGSGKSTLAMGILRLLPTDCSEITGEILFNGKDLLKMTNEEFNELRWLDISVVFQKAMNTLSPIHKIGDQFEDIYRVHDKTSSKEQIIKNIIEMLALVNLNERVLKLYPHELSGGMLQRVSIALGLMHKPKVIVLDESTTALDVVTQTQILEEIKKLERKLKMTRIMITHDMAVVASSCEKVIVLYAGRLMEFGYVKDVIKNPRHPYTIGLLNSYPTLKGEKTNLKGIEGSLPDLSERCPGCIFAARCEHATKKCFEEKPMPKTLEDGRVISCHLYN
ncbi:MAG: ABC transporter ATP-binding protein [Oscillospiraceae bacterium]